MSARTLVTVCLCAAMAAFTYGCSSDGGGTGGSTGGTGGDAGAGGGGMGGEGGAAGIRNNFETSLHNTRNGKDFWYNRANNGMELLTNVQYDEFACQGCHNKSDPDVPDPYEPSCADCHGEGDKHLQPATCLGCHGRQRAEAGMIQGMDFHAIAEFACVDCHGSNDVHGNGTEYDTMLRPGAIATRCTDCHSASGAGGAGGAPGWPDDSYHGGQHSDVDCALCHTETVISCINCHMEEDLDRGEKCQTGPVFNWKFVMKWDKEGDGNEVYHPGTMMTLKYNCDREANPEECPDQDTDPKKTFVVFAPYYAHTVTQQALDTITSSGEAFGQEGCAYCHGASNCSTIENATPEARVKLIEWDDEMKKLGNPINGLIPLPEDFRDRFEVDFAEFESGPGLGCPTMENPKPLVFFETGPDRWQTGADTTAPNKGEVGRPLTAEEFGKFCD